MRATIKAATAAAALLTAAPALALTVESTPSPAALAGARFLHAAAALTGGGGAGLLAAVVGGGLRTDGRPEFAGDASTSYGYLTSAEPSDPATTVVEPSFEDELATYRAPGTTVRYATAPGVQVVATPPGK